MGPGHVFDIALLADRLGKAAGQLQGEYARVGYFGASTGAAAALWAAAEPGADVAAVVSRSGRPDLAGDRLRLVAAPTLLIVGSRDEIVLDLNRRAQAQLHCPRALAVVPGATHLFEEPSVLRRESVEDMRRGGRGSRQRSWSTRTAWGCRSRSCSSLGGRFPGHARTCGRRGRLSVSRPNHRSTWLSQDE
jgi:dienelactone hydrolase